MINLNTALRYNKSPAIEPLAKERGEILLTTNNPPHGLYFHP
jgi:hypothetical protein